MEQIEYLVLLLIKNALKKSYFVFGSTHKITDYALNDLINIGPFSLNIYKFEH